MYLHILFYIRHIAEQKAMALWKVLNLCLRHSDVIILRSMMGSWEWGANVTSVTSRWCMDKGLNSNVFPYETALIRVSDWSLLKHHLTDYLPTGSSQRGIKWRDICPGHITNITMFPADCHTHTTWTARWHGCTQRIVCNDLRLECVE